MYVNPNRDTVSNQVYYTQQEWSEANPWAVVYNYNDEHNNSMSALLITNGEVYEYFMLTYPNYICRDMWNKFTMYNTMHAHSLMLAQYAYYAEYDPIENYNGETEHIITNEHGDETRTHKTGGDGGTHNKVTNQALSDTYTQHDTTTYDSQTFRGETKDTQHGGTETIDDLHTEDKTTHTTVNKTIGTATYTGDTITHDIERKHGNLGVTTTQSMIDAEISLRLSPVDIRYLDNFIREYAYYAGGDSDYYCGVII